MVCFVYATRVQVSWHVNLIKCYLEMINEIFGNNKLNICQAWVPGPIWMTTTGTECPPEMLKQRCRHIGDYGEVMAAAWTGQNQARSMVTWAVMTDAWVWDKQSGVQSHGWLWQVSECDINKQGVQSHGWLWQMSECDINSKECSHMGVYDRCLSVIRKSKECSHMGGFDRCLSVI